jgi:ferredoxin
MSTGACAFAAPDVFEVDAEGRVAVIGEVVAGDERVRARSTIARWRLSS